LKNSAGAAYGRSRFFMGFDMESRPRGFTLSAKLLAPQYLIIAAVVVGLFLWAAGDILVPFFIAFFLAYLFDPLADALMRRGMPRPAAALLIVGGMVLIVGLAMGLMGPVVYAQLHDVSRAVRSLMLQAVSLMRQEMSPYFPELGELLKPSEEMGASSITSLLSGGVAFLSFLGLAVLTPVVTFYMLNDWDRMMSSLMKAVPKQSRGWVRELAAEVDDVLSAFLRGQAWVCACVAVLYSIGLMIAGLQYGLVIGVISGILKFLPYIGTAIGVTIAMSTALTQPGWDGWLMAGIIAVYMTVELIESSILSPKLIGNLVRLPPALVIFAVLLGGKLMGIIGMFIAIPVFAVARVLASFWQRHQNENGDAPETQPAPAPMAAAPPAPRRKAATAKA